jgi:thiol-disulfide isomerase/thioredoxin
MPCRAELPHLVELEDRYADDGVVLIALLSEPRTKGVDEFADEIGVADYLVTDESQKATAAYRINGVPTTVMIDQAGRLMYRHVGFEEGMEEQLAAEIERLLAWRQDA